MRRQCSSVAERALACRPPCLDGLSDALSDEERGLRSPTVAAPSPEQPDGSEARTEDAEAEGEDAEPATAPQFLNELSFVEDFVA